MATSLTELTNPQLVTAPGSAGINDAWRQNALLQHLMNSLDKRQREALWGRIPGAPGSEQGAAASDIVNANRPEAQQTQAQLEAIRAGGGGGGYGIIKEPGILGQLMRMADQAAQQRQAATVEQLRLARLPLQDLRKYVDDATPQQLSELMAGYKNLRGDVKGVLEKNLEKISQTAGKASTLARDLLNEDVESMAKALDTSATEIQGHVDKANASLKAGVQEAQQMGAEAGKGAVGDIRAAVEEARKGVLPGAMAREGAMGAGYGSLAQQQARTLAASKAEGMGLAEQLGAGRKAEINERFDEMAEREGERLEQSLRARGLDNTTVAASQRQGMLAKVERGRSDALRQLNDQVAQQQLGQFNEWEKLRAMTGERVGLPGLGARERTGAAADRIAAQLESTGLGAGAQAALGTQRGEQDLGRLLAGKAGDFQMAGLQGLLQQEGAKTQAIAGGWRQKMALSAQLAQLGFTEQANALRQQADAEREIGGRSLTALQQGQQDQGRQLANVTQAQSGLEERVEHQGMNPALWLDLAKGLGVASQQGPPLGGLFGNVGGGGGGPWGQFPGGQQKPEPKPEPKPADLRNLINTISINLGGLGSPGSITGGAQSALQSGWNLLTSPGGANTLGALGGAAGGALAGTAGIMDYIGGLIQDNPQQALAFIQNPDAWFREYVGMSREDFEKLDPASRDALMKQMAADQEKGKPTVTPPAKKDEKKGGLLDPVLNLFRETAEEKAERAKAEAAKEDKGVQGQEGQAGQLGPASSGTGRILTSANAPGAQYDPVRKQWWKPKPAAPATSVTGITQPQTTTPAQGYTDQYGITYPAGHKGPVARSGSSQVTQPQITQQDLANYQQGIGRLPNHSTSGFQQLQNQFNQQQPQTVPNTVANVSNMSQTPAPTSVTSMYNNTPVNAHWTRDTQGMSDAQKSQLWNFGGSMYKA